MIRLIVDHVGPNAPQSPLDSAAQRELLDLLIKNGGGRTLLHHRGLVELHDNNYQEAERFLRRALGDKNSFGDSYRRESDQNILTSLGSIYSAWAKKLRRDQQASQADRLEAEAERCFIDARLGTFTNAYAYHAHASMLRNKARGALGLDKIDYYVDAMQIIDEAKEAVEIEFVSPILELETEIFAELGKRDEVAKAAKQLAEQHGSAAGFVAWARNEYVQLDKGAIHNRNGKLSEIVEILEEGLRADASDYRALQLLARCFQQMGKQFYEEAYRTLQRLRASYPRPEPRIYYRLACAAFRVGRLSESLAMFKDLQDLEKAIEFNIRKHEFVPDDLGKSRVFSGRVIRIDNPGMINCDGLGPPYEHIPFYKRYVRFPLVVGDMVNFFVYFNYRGPYAREMTPASKSS